MFEIIRISFANNCHLDQDTLRRCGFPHRGNKAMNKAVGMFFFFCSHREWISNSVSIYFELSLMIFPRNSTNRFDQ